MDQSKWGLGAREERPGIQSDFDAPWRLILAENPPHTVLLRVRPRVLGGVLDAHLVLFHDDSGVLGGALPRSIGDVR